MSSIHKKIHQCSYHAFDRRILIFMLSATIVLLLLMFSSGIGVVIGSVGGKATVLFLRIRRNRPREDKHRSDSIVFCFSVRARRIAQALGIWRTLVDP